MKEKTCGTCKWCIYKWNKIWCDIHDEPYPKKACDKWAPIVETKRVRYFDESEQVWKIGEVIVDE